MYFLPTTKYRQRTGMANGHSPYFFLSLLHTLLLTSFDYLPVRTSSLSLELTHSLTIILSFSFLSYVSFPCLSFSHPLSTFICFTFCFSFAILFLGYIPLFSFLYFDFPLTPSLFSVFFPCIYILPSIFSPLHFLNLSLLRLIFMPFPCTFPLSH